MEIKNNKLYLGDINVEDLAKKFGTPLYVYEEILFTGNNLTKDEMKFIYTNGLKINLNTLSEIEIFGSLLKELKVKNKTAVSISINPNVGGTQHPQNITGGPNSKFGIYFDKISEALELSAKNNLVIDSVHSHIGS